MRLRPVESILSILFLLGLLMACKPNTAVGVEGAPVPTATPVSRAKKVTIAAVGDVMLGSTSIDETFLPPNDGKDILKDFTPVLNSADLAFGNLEGPMLEGGKNEKCGPASKRCFAFRVPTRYGELLKEAGFDVMSLANNHASDFGDYGRESTRKVLDDLGIKHAGSDRTTYSTAVLEVKGLKVAFVGFAHNAVVPNVNEIEFAQKLVADAGKTADIVVVSVHGGAEGEGAQNVPYGPELYAGEKRGNLRVFTKAVIDAGADLVLGHGPHVLRGLEVYKERLIVYSMGNFATYGMFRLTGPQALTAVFEFDLDADGRFLSGKIHPGKQLGRGGPVKDSDGEAVRKIKSLTLTDFGVNGPKIGDDGVITP